jgi:D-alanyl-D-alanine carboxypeptidase/D-alanyl-D-alanine-endopeptidase (penicillin-binding protein 4)
MKHVLSLLILTLFLLTSAATAQQPVSPATVDELQKVLADHVSQPRFSAALWGIKVVSLDTSQTIFEHNSQKLFSPASNSKLYTIALALDRLGADGRIKTSLYARSRPGTDGVLAGDLVVFGRGDPTINARLHSNDIYRALQPLVAALTNAGVKRIDGDLVGDGTFLHGPPYGSGWAWDDAEYYYGAELSALTINDNIVQVSIKPGDRVGAPAKLTLIPANDYVILSNRTETIGKEASRTIRLYRPLNENVVYVTGRIAVDDAGYTEDVTLHNPAGLFVTLFREVLNRQGISVRGKVRTLTWPEAGSDVPLTNRIELGSMESPPMRDIAREVMKPSQNLYTDLLLAYVGEKARPAEGSGEVTSEDLGIRELNRFLADVGVHRGDVLFEEGSGLSRNNLTTPNATVTLLQFMAKHPCAGAFLDSLPIAGVDGTLRSRMKDTAAAKNVRAKTGTLRWANALSGHVTSAGGEHLIFSIMLNRYHDTDPNRSGRAELDAIAVLLAGFGRRTEGGDGVETLKR